MATGIEDIIAAVVEETGRHASEILSIGNELTKQPKPDYNISNSRHSNLSIANTVKFIQQGKA